MDILRWQPRKYVLQVSLGIMPVQSRRPDLAHTGSGALSAAQRARKQTGPDHYRCLATSHNGLAIRPHALGFTLTSANMLRHYPKSNF